MNTDNTHSSKPAASLRSPLLTNFPAKQFEYCTKFSMLIAGRSHSDQQNVNTIYDISHLPKFVLAGAGAERLIPQVLDCSPPKMFRGHILGHQGKIGRIAKNQFLLIDSLTGEFCEIFRKLAESTNEDAICLKTDLAEIALVGEIGSTVIAELTGLNEADIGYDDFLPCDLAAAEVFLSRAELPKPHFRLLLQSSDVNYVFQAIEAINQRLGGTKEGALSYQRYIG